MEKFGTVENSYHDHDMISHGLCHEGTNTLICYDSCHEVNLNNNDQVNDQVKQLDKSDWWYLVNQLEKWRVYNPRAVVKRNPVIAWRVMNLCKDPNVRVKGAYFTTCFRRECFKAELKSKIGA